jgi:XTP/dITP diphosphohydrolase
MRTFQEKTLLVATHNAGKLEEISDLLKPFSITVVSSKSLGLPEPVETEDNFIGNARIKAHSGAKASGLVTLADDSGICVDGLAGAPGVYTADWAETPDGRDFKLAMARTWAELETVSAPYPRTAQFRCTLVLAWPDGHDEVFEGIMPGKVIWPMRGAQGHGYDPIFVPSGHDVTFAEMAPTLKNQISHRADAFRKLVEGCIT